MIAYIADKIFAGAGWLQHHALLVDTGIFKNVVPVAELPADIPTHAWPGHHIVPAFIDLQIYGAGGKLFNMHPDVSALQLLYDHCHSGGAHHFLPTVATNTYPVFYKCIDAVREYWQQGGKGILGLHLEGPWINSDKRGAHILDLIHSPTLQQAEALLQYGEGVIKMITLAPEVCSSQVIDRVQSYGITISLGHSNATYQQATQAFDEGITVATHLYNAMSALMHRQPGVVGAVMNHSMAKASIIPDGHHVNFEAVAIAKKIMGDRLFLITDAVTQTNDGPYPHQPDGDKYVSNGILSGSALTMLKGVQNCVNEIGIPLHEAIKMASLYPAGVVGMQQQIGTIAAGCRADFLVMNDQLQIVEQVTS